jgi:hypothetical protein
MKLKLKRQPQSQYHYTQYPVYKFYLDDIEILFYAAPKKVITNIYKRHKIGLSKIPNGAKILPTKESRAPYDMKILGGWVCDKLSFTYGIYLATQDRILTQPDECLYWALSDEEIEKFLSYPHKEH